jgi:hypothetical protein
MISSNLTGTVGQSRSRVCRQNALCEEIVASLPIAARSLYRALAGYGAARIDAALLALLDARQVVRLDGQYRAVPTAAEREPVPATPTERQRRYRAARKQREARQFWNASGPTW